MDQAASSLAAPDTTPAPTPQARRIEAVPFETASLADISIAPSLRSSLSPATRGINPGNLESDPSLISKELGWQSLQGLKAILRHGTFESQGQKIKPYVFYAEGHSLVAETAGLEGFMFSEREFRTRHGEAASVALVGNYIRYVSNLLAGATSTAPAREQLDRIQRESQSEPEKYRAFIAFLSEFVGNLRDQVRSLDAAHWSHWARAYHLFIRAFNTTDWRAAYAQTGTAATGKIFEDLKPGDIELLRSQSFNCIRFMGTYPIGEVGRKGVAGGSPFALKDFSVDPSHGDRRLVNEFIRGAASQGMRTVFEMVLNHTALDSMLVEHDPRLYLHTQSRPADTTGYFHYTSEKHGEFWIRHGGYEDNGKRTYWEDTIQLDLSNPRTRHILIQIACEVVRSYGPHALRFDAVENMVHHQWKRCWDNDCRGPLQLPQEELLAEIVHAVKAQFPSVVCVAEAYKWWDKMSEMGFDLIYGLEDMEREVQSARHRGWQASLISRDPERIREAIHRAQFLHWQEGGADMVTFWGHQDKEGPWRLFGEDWKWGAAALTILKPGPFCFYAGTEAVYECPETDEPNDHKVVTFNRPVSIAWQGIHSEFGSYQRGLLDLYTRLQRELGEQLQFTLLRPADSRETWVGYAIQGPVGGPDAPKAVVLVNPSPNPTSVTIEAPELGIDRFSRELGACGKDGVKIFRFKSPRSAA